jgi:hypothetical protein
MMVHEDRCRDLKMKLNADIVEQMVGGGGSKA